MTHSLWQQEALDMQQKARKERAILDGSAFQGR